MKISKKAYRSNPHAAKGDDYEPEYLEPVTHTADKMRAAVRDYIAEYSHRCGGDSVEKGETDCDYNATTLSQCPPLIKLVGILATTTDHPVSKENCHYSYCNDPYGNETYSQQIATCCSSDGIVYEPWRVPPTIEALERAIHHANERLDIHGILVFYPVFDKLTNAEKKGRTYKCQATGVYYRSMDDYFRDLVACHKDVDGYCRKGLRIQKPESEHGAVGGDHSQHIVNAEELGPIYPCTALAVFKILESFRSSNTSSGGIAESKSMFENTTITIINRSEVLGLPLATMLSNQGATVYSIDIDSVLKFEPNGKVRREYATTTVEQCVRKSSVIVSGVPSDAFKVPTSWLSNCSTLINVATESSNFEEERLCTEAQGVTYVPHVGRVTVAALEYNLMQLHRNYHLRI
jgi:methylenetetrahydrofolate dehydrogenase (NAD+)